MPDAPNWNDLFNIARDEQLARSGKITREVIEQPGTDANIYTAAMATVGDEVIGQLVRVEAAQYLDSAKQQALDRLVYDRFGLTRKPASQALCTVTFTTTAPNPSGFSIPSGTILATADGREFITTVQANFAFGSTGPVNVAVRSVISGVSQSARIGTITSLTSPITGSPQDLVVTNLVATSGASDEETDESLRERARRFFTTARRGTLKSLVTGALNTPGVVAATAFEGIDAYGRPSGHAEVVVTDAFTETLVDETTVPASYQTQSQLLASLVSTELEEWRAAGAWVRVTVGSVALVGLTLGLRFTDDVDPDVVALNARAVVTAYINALDPGEDLLIDNIIRILRSVRGLVITGSEVLSPSGDIIVNPLRVLRTALKMIVVSSLNPDRALSNSTNPDSI